MSQTETLPAVDPLKRPELSHIFLADIIADPNQPRKFFDQQYMDELTASVRDKGVIQPITVRPMPGKKGKYMLVSGERRFRAAMNVMAAQKSRSTIPASIQDLTDDEALQVQIVENLQRQDVTPMEEATAFHSLVTRKERPLTTEDIAQAVGKSEKFVRQRLILMKLTDQWQKALFHNVISLATAMRIATFAPQLQDKLAKSENVASYIKGKQYMEIAKWTFMSLSGDLKTAPFDLSDVTLVPDMGACTTCQYNTACQRLFSEDSKEQRCTYPTCYEQKEMASFRRQLDIALTDPDVLFYSDTYDCDKKIKDMLKKEGHSIIQKNYDISTSHKATPGFIKVFVVDSGYSFKRGTYGYIKLPKKGKVEGASAGSTAAFEEKKKAGKLKAADIEAEVLRLEARDKRNKELDIQAIHLETVTQISDPGDPHNLKPDIFSMPFQKIDRGLLAFLLLDQGDCMSLEEEEKKIIGFDHHDDFDWKNKQGLEKNQYHEAYIQKLAEITDDQLAALIRYLVFSKYGRKNMQYGMGTDATTLRVIARYAGVDLAEIERAQAMKSEKKTTNIEKKIESVKALKSTLKPAAEKKPAVKKKVPAKKKAPAKKKK